MLCWNNFYCFFYVFGINLLSLMLLYLWSFYLKFTQTILSVALSYLSNLNKFCHWFLSVFSIFSVWFPHILNIDIFHRICITDLCLIICVCVCVNTYVHMWVQVLVKARSSSSGPFNWHYKWLWTTLLGCWEVN